MPVFTPEGVEEKLVEAINAGDLHSAIALFEGGATVIFTGGGTATGGVAIRDGLGERLAAKPQLTSELVNILCGDGIAVAHYKWSLTAGGIHVKRRKRPPAASTAGPELAHSRPQQGRNGVAG